MKTVINLSPEELKTIVRSHLQSKFGDVLVKDIEFNIVDNIVGYGMMERKVHVFEGVKCQVSL